MNNQLFFIAFRGKMLSIRSLTIICVISCAVQFGLGYAQANRGKRLNDSSAYETALADSTFYKEPDWIRSFFLSAGYGYPQGLRFDIGYHAGKRLTLGITFDILDSWSSDPEEGQIGFLLMITLPVQSSSLVPYLFYNYGGMIAVFGVPDTYHLFYTGILIPVHSGLYIRPEIGIVFTSKHLRGGGEGSDPEINENISRLGANLSIEFNF